MIEQDTELHDTCLLCDAPVSLVADFGSTPVADFYSKTEQEAVDLKRYPLELNHCPQCGATQLSAVVSPKLLYADFNYLTGMSHGLVAHFQNYAESIKKQKTGGQGLSCLDLGSNDGTLLGFLKASGWDALGVEPARFAAAAAREKGIDTLNEFFSPALANTILERNGGKFDVVTSNNTIANIPNLRGFIDGVRTVLKDDGCFILETIYAPAMMDNNAFDNIYHEHILYFSLYPLRAVLDSVGLRVFRFERIGTKGGSMRVWSCLKDSSIETESSVERTIAEERQRDVLDPEYYKNWFRCILELKEETLRWFDLEEGKCLSYGASHSTTTLLHFFEIGNRISALVDDNPLKHGTYSPGFGLPVLSSDELLNDKNFRLFLNAWRFSEPIEARIRSTGMSGLVEMASPLPHFNSKNIV